MNRHPAPEENWGKDNSSLILAEQSKSLPEGIAKESKIDKAEVELDAACREITGKDKTELL